MNNQNIRKRGGPSNARLKERKRKATSSQSPQFVAQPTSSQSPQFVAHPTSS